MRSTDERMRAVLGRARAREAAARRARQRAAAIGGGVLGVVAVIAFGVGMASVQAPGPTVPGGPFGLMGSVFADSAALGYVAVGLLGLALGVVITVLMYRAGRRRRDASNPKAVFREEDDSE